MNSNVTNLTEIRSVFLGLQQAKGYGQPNVGADYADKQRSMDCAELTLSETPGPHTLFQQQDRVTSLYH